MTIEKIKKFITDYKQYRSDNVVPAYAELKRLGLTNVPDDPKGWYISRETATKTGRADIPESEWRDQHGRTLLVLVSWTDAERTALDNYNESVKYTNKLYKAVEPAETLLKALSGKLMPSRYDGKSSFTGVEFVAGTEIYYTNTGLKKLVLPTSEIDQAVESVCEKIDEATR